MQPKFLTFSAIPIFRMRLSTYRKKPVEFCFLVGLFFNLSLAAQDMVKINTGGNPVIFGNGLLISRSTASAELDSKTAHNCETIENSIYTNYPFLQNIV